MSTFLNDYKVFFDVILSSIKSVYSWLFTTVIGEIMIFTVLITLFITILVLFANFKN